MSKARATALLVLLLLAAAHAAAGRQADAPTPYRLALPDRGWALDIRLPGFTLPAAAPYETRGGMAAVVLGPLLAPVEEFSEDGRSFRLRVVRKRNDEPRTSLSLSILLRPIQSSGGAADFRASQLAEMTEGSKEVTGGEFFWEGTARVKVSRGSVKTWDYQGVPVASLSTVIERDEQVYNGGTMPRVSSGSKHITAFYVKDGVGVTVTLSGKAIKDDEEKLFYSLLDSVRLADTSSPASSYDYYHRGRLLFLRKDYAAAAAALGEALARERQGRQLDQTSWRDLVAKLADASGAGGDSARAREVLEYGAGEEPSNRFFLMGLARLYASLGDADKTLDALGKAFAAMRRDNPSASLPDLKNDPAFKRFMQDERFSKAVKEMRK
jgi:hypothetical protein